jgi:hypothetical protein
MWLSGGCRGALPSSGLAFFPGMLAPRPEAVAVWRGLNNQVIVKLIHDHTPCVLEWLGKGEDWAE